MSSFRALHERRLFRPSVYSISPRRFPPFSSCVALVCFNPLLPPTLLLLLLLLPMFGIIFLSFCPTDPKKNDDDDEDAS